MSLGRSTDEILRSIDSVQLTRKYENKVCTPADWTVKVDIFEEGLISDIVFSAYSAPWSGLLVNPWQKKKCIKEFVPQVGLELTLLEPVCCKKQQKNCSWPVTGLRNRTTLKDLNDSKLIVYESK